jgi:hypothetical protein
MDELKDFMLLLQLSAVTAVASVLILGVSTDLFAVEPTGIFEPDGRPVFALKYRGKLAANFRHVVFGVGLFLASAYIPLMCAVIASVTVAPRLFTASFLLKLFIVVVSLTILAVSFIAFLAILLRFMYMRNSGAHLRA